MSDPTLSRLQHGARRKRSSFVVAALAAMLVAAVGAAGVYVLTASHSSTTASVPLAGQ